MRKPLLPGAFFLLVKVLSRITCRGRGDMGFDVVVCKGEVLEVLELDTNLGHEVGWFLTTFSEEIVNWKRMCSIKRELSGRIIRVEFAKRFKKPSPPPSPPPAGPPAGETRHKLYVSNLAWKVRSTHLREFFSSNFNPVSVRVVFDSPSGRSGGYGLPHCHKGGSRGCDFCFGWEGCETYSVI
ncbi:hypothetical protein CK203_017269 [Vitis vinifera]|uniref:RRM domain-containing protein n=1 Tax=Vitis vinifera TaxID=29760 RepID=A0A438JZK9_VITVI|nr:hypothetical protein CK203_017269 [Vitis vinifera]